MNENIVPLWRHTGSVGRFERRLRYASIESRVRLYRGNVPRRDHSSFATATLQIRSVAGMRTYIYSSSRSAVVRIFALPGLERLTS